MNENEPKGDRGGCGDWIDTALLALVRIGDQAADQAGNVLRARADKIGNGGIGFAVALADKSAFGAPAHVGEARVADDDALQVQECIAAERPVPGFADGLPPPLDAILSGPLPLDDV